MRQISHQFQYGANIFLLDELENKDKNRMNRDLFKGVCNLATLPFYWCDPEPMEGKLRYEKTAKKIYRRPAPDTCLEFCEENKITPKAHCLVYDAFTPKWAANDVDIIKNLLEKRFAELSERYSKKIHSWEVTNETFYGGEKTKLFYQDDLVEWSFGLVKNTSLTVI